jgi:hypothetical protein
MVGVVLFALGNFFTCFGAQRLENGGTKARRYGLLIIGACLLFVGLCLVALVPALI